MNYAEFITAITDIYGQYQSEPLKRITIKYVMERFQESELENIFGQLIIKVNPKFKTPPSPADFEEFFPKRSLEAEAQEWYIKLSSTGNSLDDVIISDIRAQKALISSFGSWPSFCQRNPESEQWHRKNYVDAYLKVSPTDEQPTLMFGESSRKGLKIPLMFGDREKCLQIAQADKVKQVEFMSEVDKMAGGMRI